jgi:hypothetical protein
MDVPPDSVERGATGQLGTRFLIFPQPPFVPGYERPEVVWISTPAGQIRAGPADSRVYVVDPSLPKPPYQAPYLPPFSGAPAPPAEPDADGHFDYLAPDARPFLAAHAFASVRHVLDICEGYLGRRLPWFFEPTYERLEIVPHIAWDNAQSGFGFLELGEDDSWPDRPFPFGLNFDVIAHETGHIVLLGALGLPENGSVGEDFLAYHEAIADLISLVGLLHFDSALDKILRRTKGNLLIANELDRLAELSDSKQLRMASHSLKMRDVGFEVHDRSRPFTGAVFDTGVEIFQLLLCERGLAKLDTRTIRDVRSDLTQTDIDGELQVSRDDYELHHFATKATLAEARDLMGEMLIGSWRRLDPEGLTFREAAEAIVLAAEAGRARRFADRVYENFAWRGIL